MKELQEDTAEALLLAIKAHGEVGDTIPAASELRDLAEAYATVVAAMPERSAYEDEELAVVTG